MPAPGLGSQTGPKGDDADGAIQNERAGAAQARKMGLDLITFSGFKEDNPLRSMGSLNFWINSKSYNFVEMTHHIWLLAIVDKIVEEL